MPLFYPDPKPKNAQGQEEFNTQGAVMLVVGLLALLGYNKLPRWGWLYFRYYEHIWLSAYALLCLAALLTFLSIVKRTKPLAERVRLLGQLCESDHRIFVGLTEDGADIHLSEEARTGHVQILGSTGRGKTESVIIPWMGRDIYQQRSAILICGKGDRELSDTLREWATKTRLNPRFLTFDLGNPSFSCKTNPLRCGSAQQITDRLFTAFTFEQSFYKSVQYDATSCLVQLIQEGPEKIVTFRRLYDLLTDDIHLTEMMSQSTNIKLKEKLGQFLSLARNTREERFSGLLSQIAPFAVGEVAPLVNGEPAGSCVPEISISEIVLGQDDDQPARQTVAIFLVPTLKYQEIGHQLGKLLLQELGWAVGERASRTGKNATFLPVYLDEFSAFVYAGFANILNKARSSRVALHLSHQSLADLGTVSPEFAQIVTTNTNVKCILGLNDPESADFMSRHMGTRTEEKLTEQAEEGGFLSPRKKTGSLSIREVEAYKIHPNLLKNYVNGKGVLHLPTPRGNITEPIQFRRLKEIELHRVWRKICKETSDSPIVI